MDKADAGTFMSLFIAACYFFPLIGGYIADNFLGKYWTIVVFSVPYVVAQFIVGIENRYVVFGALVLLAMGSGVIKPNISTLMGMTYDQQRPGQEQLRTSAFSWFYMAINIGAALSQFAMPWLRNEYGYQVGVPVPGRADGPGPVHLRPRQAVLRARKTIERKVVGDGRASGSRTATTITGIPVKYKVVTAEEKAADRALKLPDPLPHRGAVPDRHVLLGHLRPVGQHLDLLRRHVHGHHPVRLQRSPADRSRRSTRCSSSLLVPVSVWLFKTLDQAGVQGEGDAEDDGRVHPDRAEHGHHEPRRVPGRGRSRTR